MAEPKPKAPSRGSVSLPLLPNTPQRRHRASRSVGEGAKLREAGGAAAATPGEGSPAAPKTGDAPHRRSSTLDTTHSDSQQSAGASGKKRKKTNLMDLLANENKAFQDYLVSTTAIARSNKQYGQQRRLIALGKRNEREALLKARRARRKERRALRAQARAERRARDRRAKAAGRKSSTKARGWNATTKLQPKKAPTSIFYTQACSCACTGLLLRAHACSV